MSARPLRLPGPHGGLRIGLFGGSFNPAHEGHRHVAETALTRLQLDWVWWVVARGNPLKSRHGAFEARLASAGRHASHPRMRVTDLERQLGITYTRDLVAPLLARCPTARFVWIMGADNLAGFHLWGGWDGIMGSLPVAVIARPYAGPRARLSKAARRFAGDRMPQAAASRLALAKPPAWVFLAAPWHPASSTRIRGAARARNPFRAAERTGPLEPRQVVVSGDLSADM